MCLAVSSFAAVGGTVVDSAGNPVADAMIMYTNIANRLVYAYSNQSGQFCLADPTAGIDPYNLQMYFKPGCNTPVQTPLVQRRHSSAFHVFTRGSTVFFTVTGGSHQVTAGIYDCRGNLVRNLVDKSLSEGTYSFAPRMNGSSRLSGQMYLVRISDGECTETFHMANLGAASATGGLHNSADAESSAPVSLEKVTAVDGVRVGKTGFKAATVQINSYNDNVGTVKIMSANIEHRVDSLLALMTIDEKIGQLMQPSGCDANVAKNNLLGSYLKGEGSADPMNGALQTRLKIPLIVGNDWVHGGRHVYFPHEIGLGCSQDTLLVELAYRIYSMNVIPLYDNENFTPCLDVHRNDNSGRVYEGFAETPELTCLMARAAVRGIQGTDLSSGYTMIATLKHWAAGGGTAGGGGGTDANTAPDLKTLAQIHFPPFREGVKAGAGAVMTGYQSVSNTPMSINKQLITDTLKNGWGFDGFVISDWATCNGHEGQSIDAGHDLCMTITLGQFQTNVKNWSNGNQTNLARIDDAVKRLLRAKFRLGLFENPMPNLSLNNYVASDDYRKVARACVRKSLVLLKNDGPTLPLKKTQKICVVGTWADHLGYQCGGWSATSAPLSNNSNTLNGGDEGWQGTGNAHGIAGATTILQAIQGAITTGGRVDYKSNGSGIPTDADVIVVAVGETPYAEYAGDRGGDISLSGDLQTLVQTCANSGKPVVTILITGRPNVLGTIPANSKALVAAWLPGTEGTGIADVLFGDYDFTGKLCVTWPASNGQEPINAGSMGDVSGSGGQPLYQYGFGLTYKQ
jgi:beta-glucosidase